MADESGKIQWILDGNHRAQKALRSKSETIPAKIIKPSNLDAKAKKVLLGIPMLNESYDYDEVSQSEFGMDYDQLGPGEKEWVRDEIDNMTFEGQVNEVSTHLSEAKTPEELIKVSDELEKFINDISDDIDQEDLDKLSDVLTTVRGNIKNMLKK
jgi:hypothetical protein